MTSNSQTEIKKLERNKAERTRYKGIFKKRKAIVAQGKSINSLNRIELSVLFDWTKFQRRTEVTMIVTSQRRSRSG